jgi:hypothetical protein
MTYARLSALRLARKQRPFDAHRLPGGSEQAVTIILSFLKGEMSPGALLTRPPMC